MSDRQRIGENEKNILENRSTIARILGIINNGLVDRMARIENRMWALMVGLVFILITVIAELVVILCRGK